MKSMRINSYGSRSKIVKSQRSLSKKDTKSTFNEKPTPLDFDSFIPWFCLELQLPKNVVVLRTNQVEYVRYDSKVSKASSTKSTSKLRTRSTKMKFDDDQSIVDHKIKSAPQKISLATSTIDIHDSIPITTCYDRRGSLVGIEIIGCRFAIPRQVIRAISLCLPFHPGLSKLSIRKGGLCKSIIYEISKLLPHSNITDLCLDDSGVREGNYSIVLDKPSQVKYLSLKRCGIESKECKNIASKLDLNGPAIKTLLLLDLASNLVMDEGAQALGEMLKNNRCLVYLNISENNISDTGASFILRYLQEFPLTFDDVIEKRRRRMNYLISKSIFYEKFLEEAKIDRLNKIKSADNSARSDVTKSNRNISSQNKPKKAKKSVMSTFSIEKITVEEEAEKKTKEIIGEFEDPFEERYIKRKDNTLYGIGNLALASLNLAYNNLSVLSIKNILKVLKYQAEIRKLTLNTGLLRVLIDGNDIPNNCNELYDIDICLKRFFLQHGRSFIQNRHSVSQKACL